MVYMYHSFLIHSSADGHLGCFHVLAMINSAAMNIPPQYSCLENSMDRGAWQATVHGVTRSWTQLSVWARTHISYLSLSHFELIFVYGVRMCSDFTDWYGLSSIPSTTCWREFAFSVVCSCFLCWRLTVGVWVYFLVFCSVPLSHMSVCVCVCVCVCVTLTHYFDYCSFVVLSHFWKGYASCFVIFP